jgi:hypothetical protein
VVIGSVTIGNGCSSSISTGPSKDLYITVGQVGSSKQRAKSDASSSELSSVSSEPAVKSNDYRLRLFGSSNTSKGASYDRSETSRCTMPMTQAKFERVRFGNNLDISFVDWKAASRVISEYRNPTNVTDVVAAQRQKQFFFDMYTSHVQSSSSDSNRVSASSLDSCVRYDSKALESSTCEEALLVPWRRGGFSCAFKTSDGKPSEESESSRSFYMENWARKDFISPRQSSRTHPVHSLFKRAKVVVQSWFKHKQYQNLNGRLHEDLSVISMQSYSSSVQLIPTPRSGEAFGLPELLLGTWAAATIPVGAPKRSPMARSLESDVETAFDNITTNPRSEEHMSCQAKSALLGIQRRDLDSGPCGLESSTGWSSSSIRHGSFISSCSSTTWNHENNISCGARVVDVSQAVSEDYSTIESCLGSKTEEVKSYSDRASLNIVSDSSESKEMSAALGRMRFGVVNPNEICSSSSPKKAHDCTFFMMPANIRADASSIQQFSTRMSEDWSHNVSDSSASSESGSIDKDENDHSLSVSLESGSDIAFQALEWAITQEVSKKMNLSCSNSTVLFPKNG